MGKEKVKDPAKDHKTLKIWAAIVFTSLIFSSALLFWSPGVTGFISYDTGPNPEFNPDFVGQDDYSSHLGTTALFIGLIIIFQVGAYFMVSNFYDHLE